MAWDNTRCREGILAPDLNDEIRLNNEAIESDLNREHLFSTGGTAADQIIHRQGSARCFWQASAPTTRIDGEAFTSSDLGSLWVDSDDNKVYILTATTPTWTNISVELFATFLAAARVFGSTLGVTGDFAVNTNKFTVAAATGNTVVAGTLGATGVTTVAKGSLLASSDAPTTDAMIANKKYVDDNVKNVVILTDEKATTTDGGTFTSGAWRKRTVTEKSDAQSLCSVASSVIVLSAGTYECEISCPAFRVDKHQARLQNTTGATTLVLGTSEISDDNATGQCTTKSIIRGIFTVAASQNLEIQHQCETTHADTGFGASADFDAEVYTIAKFRKIG